MVPSGYIRIMPIDSSADGKAITTAEHQVGYVIETAQDEQEYTTGILVIVKKSEMRPGGNPPVLKTAVIGKIFP